MPQPPHPSVIIPPIAKACGIIELLHKFNLDVIRFKHLLAILPLERSEARKLKWSFIGETDG